MKTVKRQNKWIHKYFGEQVEIRMKMARMVFLMIFIGLVFDLIFNFFAMQQRGINLLAPFLGMVSLLAAFLLSVRVKNVEKMMFVILLLGNVYLFPLAFLYGGGAESGEPMWMLLGALMAFLLLNGWYLYIMLFITFFSFRIAYRISFVNPELFSDLKGQPIMQINSGLGLLTAGIIVGLLFRYQNKIYEEQRELAEQRMKEIEELSDSKSLFFANMSHEIRTPINTIIGLNEMILREDVSEEIAENAINIQNASKILLALINDILDLSKMESGKMEIVPAQYETASMFSDLVNIIWVRANQKKLEFKIDIDENIPSMLYGDEVRIKQVLTNILTNAVKYTETGSVTLTVKGERLDENLIRLRMAVEDTGIGIKKESLDDLFTVFKRVDQEKTKKIEGTGLGLALSKQLVDMMGGTITVDSIYQKGSSFTVTLDQQIVDPSPLGSMKYASKRSAANRERYDRSFEAPDARVLVVDDNEMNLMVAKKLLRDTKVQVELAASGEECLEKTKEGSYHIILMDHMMPGLDGEETLKILRGRQEGYCQNAPVVALTANVMTNANEWYQQRGFDGYLAKPISGALLEAVLLKFLPEDLVEYSAVEAANPEEPEYAAMSFHRKKKKLCICTNCVCDLPQELIEENDIKLVYCYVVTEEGRFADTREVGSSELMRYLARGKIARTESASQEEYEAFFADRLVEADRVIFLSLPAGIRSDDYATAMRAAKNFDNVTVFDSGYVSAGLGLLVMQAVNRAKQGAEAEEILELLPKTREKVSSSFLLESVDSMYANGQIGKKLWQISKLLQLHPIIGMSGGKFVIQGIRTGKMDQAAKLYIRRQLRNPKKIDERLLIVAYVGLNRKQLEDIRQEIVKQMSFDTIQFQKAAAGVASNCGMGTFGLFYLRK